MILDHSKLKFSMITCTYNSEKYLSDCINSVESQGYQDFEHIFVDAFSTDQTLAIISAYQLRHPDKVTLIQREPKGISNAMNQGIAEAKGKYILFLHSDDYLYNDQALAHVKDMFQKTDADVVVGNCLYKKSDGMHTIWPQNTMLQRSLFRMMGSYLFLRNGIPHPSTVMKKSVFDIHGTFSEELCVVMDYELWFRVFKRVRFVFTPQFVSVYRAHDATTSGLQAEKGVVEKKQVIQKYKRAYILEYVLYMCIIKPLSACSKAIKYRKPV